MWLTLLGDNGVLLVVVLERSQIIDISGIEGGQFGWHYYCPHLLTSGHYSQLTKQYTAPLSAPVSGDLLHTWLHQTDTRLPIARPIDNSTHIVMLHLNITFHMKTCP